MAMSLRFFNKTEWNGEFTNSLLLYKPTKSMAEKVGFPPCNTSCLGLLVGAKLDLNLSRILDTTSPFKDAHH